jgi:hypothetical protein
MKQVGNPFTIYSACAPIDDHLYPFRIYVCMHLVCFLYSKKDENKKWKKERTKEK